MDRRSRLRATVSKATEIDQASECGNSNGSKVPVQDLTDGLPPHQPAEQPRWHKGDARDLSFLPAASIDVIVTSPPYWQRRDYKDARQLGQEATAQEYVNALVLAMDNWSRLLRPHGSIFLNLGDTYRDGFLAGIPARFEIAARGVGWNFPNHIVWTKSIGRPEPCSQRLASRHEVIFHITRSTQARTFFFDLYALGRSMGRSANPGDVWQDYADDVWDLYPARSRSEHPAPFPPELARRAILAGCPERVCSLCKHPYARDLRPTAELDRKRPQAVRALELFREHGLTEEHLGAIRAVGISDAGKGKQIQNGSGRNSAKVQRLADEAKEALGGYFREFTFAPKRHVGWIRCSCGAPTITGSVLDPFMGSGTTLMVAHELGRNATGIDLSVPQELKAVH